MPLKRILLRIVFFLACLGKLQAFPHPRLYMFIPGAALAAAGKQNLWRERFNLFVQTEEDALPTARGLAFEKRDRTGDSVEISDAGMDTLSSQSAVSECHLLEALKNYPEADRLLLRKNDRGAVTGMEAPDPWFSHHLTLNLTEDKKATQALARIFHTE